MEFAKSLAVNLNLNAIHLYSMSFIVARSDWLVDLFKSSLVYGVKVVDTCSKESVLHLTLFQLR